MLKTKTPKNDNQTPASLSAAELNAISGSRGLFQLNLKKYRHAPSVYGVPETIKEGSRAPHAFGSHSFGLHFFR